MTYTCSRGHLIEAPTLDRCPAYRHGQPCPGTLTAEGEGARAENHRLRGQHQPELEGCDV